MNDGNPTRRPNPGEPAMQQTLHYLAWLKKSLQDLADALGVEVTERRVEIYLENLAPLGPRRLKHAFERALEEFTPQRTDDFPSLAYLRGLTASYQPPEEELQARQAAIAEPYLRRRAALTGADRTPLPESADDEQVPVSEILDEARRLGLPRGMEGRQVPPLSEDAYNARLALLRGQRDRLLQQAEKQGGTPA